MQETESEFFSHSQRVQEFLPLNLSEADTRVHLVDPILKILGYIRIGDIRREVPIPATREWVDYELRIDGRPQALVEAKALRHSITDQDAAQCVQYASVLGIPWCIITNGVVWQLYYAYAKGPLASKKVAQVRLDGDGEAVSEAWRVLSLVAKNSLTQANPLTKLLIERVVIDDLSRPESSAVLALRRAVRERFGEQVPAQAVLEVLNLMKHNANVSERAIGVLAGETAVVAQGPRRMRRTTPGVSSALTALVDAGLLPPDATLECKLYGVTHAARLRDGKIDLNGRLYESPSAAAGALRNGKASNGWIIWKYKTEFLSDLRSRLASSATNLGTA